MDVYCGVSEVYVVTRYLFRLPFMRKNTPILPTNLAWDRLSLEPITLDKLKPRLRSGSVRIALATGTGLRFMTVTRHPILAGRKAKRVKRGWWETYEAGIGWVTISNDCHIWLNP